MIAAQGGAEPFVVAGESTEVTEPAERSLDHPATRKQHETLLRLGVLDDLQCDAMFARLIGGRRFLASTITAEGDSSRSLRMRSMIHSP